MTDKLQAMKDRKEVFRFGCWSIELRKRNNNPGMKPWILCQGRELFSYDGKKIRQRSSMPVEAIPEEVLVELKKFPVP